MGLSLGIIGLPNVGKSTLFNVLTQGQAEASNYPFCTVEPNIGMVAVPDERLGGLGAILAPDSITPATVRFVDIAGLVQGASHGEGLGNQFLGHIRQTDALVQVLRCFEDPQVSHVDGTIDPVRDAQVLQTELLLADLEVVQRGIPRLQRVAQTHPRSEAGRQIEALEKAVAALERGIPAAQLEEVIQSELAPYDLLTAKPIMYVANVGEEEGADGGEWGATLGAAFEDEPILAISAQIEWEISQLPSQERGQFLQDLGIEKTGIQRLIQEGARLLDLIVFYTVANNKLQAWHLKRGSLVTRAAGTVHSDMERGFIRAEVAAAGDLLALGSMSALKEAGKLPTQGQDYAVQDGDVVNILFKV